MLDRPVKPGSIGLPIDGVEFKLMDDQGKEITEPLVAGEICIKGPNVMKGYYKRPEATAEVIKNGWFTTGDIAHRDADGYYFIVDRKKDMIIRGGYNVYPREVEEVLYGHPAVLEAAVIGMKHESHGEEVKAVIALKPGHAGDARGHHRLLQGEARRVQVPAGRRVPRELAEDRDRQDSEARIARMSGRVSQAACIE